MPVARLTRRRPVPAARLALLDPLKRNRPLRPLAFIRAFGCVDERFKPVRTGRCRGFQPARIDGFAYHPHPIMGHR